MHDHLQNATLNDRECVARRLVLESTPQCVTVGLTNKCNLRCVMCPTRALDLPKIDLPLEAVQGLDSFLCRARDIHWSECGEFFASSQTAQFLELTRRYQPEISWVTSNFQLFDRWVDEVFASHLTDIEISVDASNKGTYEQVRRGAHWSRLVRNIKLFNNRRRQLKRLLPRLRLCFVVMRENLSQMQEFVEFAHRHEVVSVSFITMTRVSDEVEQHRADRTEEQRLFQEAARRAAQLGLEIEHSHFTPEPYSPPPELERPPASPPPTPEPPPAHVPLPRLHHRSRYNGGLGPVCPAPWQHFMVCNNGDVIPCCIKPVVLGNIHEQTCEEIWNGPAYQELRRQFAADEFAQCGSCTMLSGLLAERAAQMGLTPAELRRQPPSDDGLAALQRQLGNAAIRHNSLRADADILFEAVESLKQQLAETRGHSYNMAPDGLASDHDATMDALFFQVEYLDHDTPRQLAPGEKTQVNLRFMNTSSAVWPTRGGLQVVYLGCGWYAPDGRFIQEGNSCVPLPAEAPPFVPLSVQAPLTAPSAPGEYVLQWDLLYNCVSWFRRRGSTPLEIEVSVGAED